MQKVAFLDRDGTIIWEPERPEGIDPRWTFPLNSPEQVSFMDGALDGMKRLKEKGYALVLATNQTFLGTDYHPQGVFDGVMKRLTDTLAENGLAFDFVMVCPHGPDDGCECRKPKIGGLKEYLSAHDVDREHSFMFGDRDSDGEFAQNLGVRFVRVKTNGRFELPDGI